jgi:hypothetical protein
MGKQAAMGNCKVVLIIMYRVEEDHEKYSFVDIGVGRGGQTAYLPLPEF